MSYSFSTDSKVKLLTCDEKLQIIAWEAIQVVDFIVLEGHRNPEKQLELYNKGKSKVKCGNHNYTPSRAVDIAPYPLPTNWGETNKYELARFYYLTGVWKGIAHKHNIKIRWGGDWNMNNIFTDNKWNDLVHYELIGV